MVLALMGSHLAVYGRWQSATAIMRAIIKLTGSVGLGGDWHLSSRCSCVGFLMFAVVGWIGARVDPDAGIRPSKSAIESVTVDAIWMLFAIVHSVNLVFGHPLWVSGRAWSHSSPTRSCVRVGLKVAGTPR